MSATGETNDNTGDSSDRIPCPACQGLGVLAVCFLCMGTGHLAATDEPCGVCKGTGNIQASGTDPRADGPLITCADCEGTGWVPA